MNSEKDALTSLTDSPSDKLRPFHHAMSYQTQFFQKAVIAMRDDKDCLERAGACAHKLDRMCCVVGWTEQANVEPIPIEALLVGLLKQDVDHVVAVNPESTDSLDEYPYVVFT